MAFRVTVGIVDGELVGSAVEIDSSRSTRARSRELPSAPVALREDIEAVGSVLLDPTRMVPASDVDTSALNRTGLYLFRLRPEATLPEPFEAARSARNTDLLYLGKAENATLAKRMVEQELRGRGRGTFIRSIGTVLGYRPATGSLIGKANPNNYVFAKHDLDEIVTWINTNIFVSYVMVDNHIAQIESSLIVEHTPLLNLTDNPLALTGLKNLRAECRQIGLSQPPSE